LFFDGPFLGLQTFGVVRQLSEIVFVSRDKMFQGFGKHWAAFDRLSWLCLDGVFGCDSGIVVASEQ